MAQQLATSLDVTPWLTPFKGVAPDFTLIGVYRRRNAALMRDLAFQAPAVRLWGLDGSHPLLADATVGEGPGGRFDLLTRLADGVTSQFLVVADDDVRLVAQSVAALVAIAARFELDLCQPAHGFRSVHSHGITRRRAMSVLRLTNFVEIGPLLVIGPRLRDALVPFPSELGMGWGTDVAWMDLCESLDARMAIVDAVLIKHVGKLQAAYDTQAEHARLTALLRERGAAEVADLWRQFGTVRPWSRRLRDG